MRLSTTGSNARSTSFDSKGKITPSRRWTFGWARRVLLLGSCPCMCFPVHSPWLSRLRFESNTRRPSTDLSLGKHLSDCLHLSASIAVFRMWRGLPPDIGASGEVIHHHCSLLQRVHKIVSLLLSLFPCVLFFICLWDDCLQDEPGRQRRSGPSGSAFDYLVWSYVAHAGQEHRVLVVGDEAMLKTLARFSLGDEGILSLCERRKEWISLSSRSCKRRKRTHPEGWTETSAQAGKVLLDEIDGSCEAT